MDNSNKIVPPHLNAEVYRSDTTGTSSFNYLDYIRIHPDGSILVGCSELTGRYWNGGAYVFNNIEEAKNCIRDSKFSITLSSGTADGCFIQNSDKVLLGEDNGALSIWSHTVNDAWKVWNEEIKVSEHDDSILAMDCLNPGKRYITSSSDGTAKVWDMHELIAVKNYNSVHGRAINGLSVRPYTTNQFATGSLDYYISLWDEYIDKSAADIVKNDSGVRCVRWLDENQLLFGDDAGYLSIVDVRKPKEIIKLIEFPAAVHQMSVQQGSTKVAVCCDNKTVTVCNIEGLNANIIYQNKDSHKAFVRCLTWESEPTKKNILHTSGWDGAIMTHEI